MALCLLGKATEELGDPVAARSLLEESAALLRVVGDWQRLALPLNALGLLALRQGDYASARARFEEALSVARETEDEQYIADALAHLGTVALRMGTYQQSAAFYQQSLAINRAQRYRDGIAEDLAGLAELASLLGQPERAACLFGAVEALRETSNISLPPLHRAAYNRIVGGIRARLDDATFATTWTQGRAMSLEQAYAYALETKDARPTAIAEPQANGEEAPSDLSLGVLSPAPSPPLSPRGVLQQQLGGLTAREVEVLRLLAQGLTSAQIAEQLVIGIVTVNSHVRSIYSKLGVSSRSAATRYAMEHHLL
jgi:DNA-binding CsgD family transcriptional regulator